MYAVSSSGGKDSTFALFKALEQNFKVTHLIHVYNPDTSRVRFHGYKPEMVSKQAELLGLKEIIKPTRSEKFEQDFELVLKEAKKQGIKGLIFGNLFLEDVREFYQKNVTNAGLEYYDVLWKQPTEKVLKNFIKTGFKAIITSVWLKKLDKKFLGKHINEKFLKEIKKEKNVDFCGENGEYHSLVFNGPLFKKPLEYETFGVHEEKENIFLDIRKKEN